MSADTVIGRHVTIGAGSLLRSVTVEDEAVIGARCIIMEGSVVETGAVLADGTLVPPGRRIPAKQLWAGAPAKFVRDMTYDEAYEIVDVAESIAAVADAHSAELLPQTDMALYREADARLAQLTALVRAERAAIPAAAAAV
jgi:carbonic anhydrase/acetyltransferase-like protein (isoleucine patch superfamily)